MKRLALALSLLLFTSPLDAQRVDGSGVRLNGGSSVVVGDGTASAPSITFVNERTSGLYRNGTNDIRLSDGTSDEMRWFQNGVILRSDALLGFAANTSLSSTLDAYISRRGAGEFGWVNTTFSALGTPADGTFAYCSDCTIANPCAGSGTGAFAKRLNGVWVCN